MKTLAGIIIGISVLGCANDAEKLFSAQGGGGSTSEGGGGAAEGGGGSASSQGGQNEGGEGGEAQTSTSSGPCIPKSCFEIGLELSDEQQASPESCGLVFDGCSANVDCGTCSNAHDFCPENPAHGTPGLCKSNCFLSPNQFGICSDTTKKVWECYEITSLPPNESCTKLGSGSGNTTLAWCCN